VPTIGGEPLLLTGSNFGTADASPRLLVRSVFGQEAVAGPGRWVSDSAVQVRSPAGAGVAWLALQVAGQRSQWGPPCAGDVNATDGWNTTDAGDEAPDEAAANATSEDGLDGVCGGAAQVLYRAPRVMRVHPRVGPRSGGTRVQFVGDGFGAAGEAAALALLIGDAPCLSPTRESDTEAACVSGRWEGTAPDGVGRAAGVELAGRSGGWAAELGTHPALAEFSYVGESRPVGLRVDPNATLVTGQWGAPGGAAWLAAFAEELAAQIDAGSPSRPPSLLLPLPVSLLYTHSLPP